MSLRQDIDALHKRLGELASDTDDELAGRYTLRRPPAPPGVYWKLRWLAGWILRWLEEKANWQRDHWPVSLKGQHNKKAKPLLVWSLGSDRDTLRRACDDLSGLQESLPDLAPVLVTDVADFAYFSRLGWLVEYVPDLSGHGKPYDECKLRFIARLYRGAKLVPVNDKLYSQRWIDDVRQSLAIDS